MAPDPQNVDLLRLEQSCVEPALLCQESKTYHARYYLQSNAIWRKLCSVLWRLSKNLFSYQRQVLCLYRSCLPQHFSSLPSIKDFDHHWKYATDGAAKRSKCWRACSLKSRFSFGSWWATPLKYRIRPCHAPSFHWTWIKCPSFLLSHFHLHRD